MRKKPTKKKTETNQAKINRLLKEIDTHKNNLKNIRARMKKELANDKKKTRKSRK